MHIYCVYDLKEYISISVSPGCPEGQESCPQTDGNYTCVKKAVGCNYDYSISMSFYTYINNCIGSNNWRSFKTLAYTRTISDI